MLAVYCTRCSTKDDTVWHFSLLNCKLALLLSPQQPKFIVYAALCGWVVKCGTYSKYALPVAVGAIFFLGFSFAITKYFCDLTSTSKGWYTLKGQASACVPQEYEFARLPLISSPSQAEAWPLLVYCQRLLMALTLIVHARVSQKRYAPFR